jgi:hypothetical protein
LLRVKSTELKCSFCLALTLSIQSP